MKYESERVQLLAYIDGQPNPFPETFLPACYQQIREEGTMETVFPGVPMTLAKFCKFFADKVVTVGMVKSPDGQSEVAAIGWLFDVEGPEGARKATVGYVFFKKFWGREEVREICRMTLRMWFEDLKIDALFGIALKRNEMALRMNRVLGFERVAEVPKYLIRDGHLEDSVWVMQTRSKFLGEVTA